MLRKDNSTIYEQIRQDILRKIENGEFTDKKKLPGERTMEASYGVSRASIRHAISMLEQEGVLVRKHGSGTYVAEKKMTQSITELRGILEDLKDSGAKINCTVLLTKRMEYTLDLHDIWEALHLLQNQKIYYVERLFYADGTPLLIEKNYFPEEVGKQCSNFDFTRDIIYDGLELLGYTVHDAHQEILARIPEDHERDVLNLGKKAAVLSVQRVNYSVNKDPVLFAEAVIAGERYSYTMDLKRRIGT